MKHKKLAIFMGIMLVIAVYVVGVLGYIVWDNYRVVTTTYSIYSDKLPSSFDKYKIALITDFHDSDNVDKVVAHVKAMEPNIICLAGDMINMDDKNYDNFASLLDELVKIALTYYNFGNHEVWSNDQDAISTLVTSKGVIMMNNDVRVIKEENTEINIVGLKDPGRDDFHIRKDYIKDNLKMLYDKIEDKDTFTLLLMHRANYFSLAAAFPYDVVLSGHLHNGQVNLPLIQQQILLHNVNSDQYTRGLYREKDSQMVISAGLEKNLREPRVFNTPEVVCVQLNSIN